VFELCGRADVFDEVDFHEGHFERGFVCNFGGREKKNFVWTILEERGIRMDDVVARTETIS